MDLVAARERLSQVPDPEIPAVTLMDLGIVRDLRATDAGLEVVLTPTYSGCPATELIADDVRAALAGFGAVTITLQRVPAWSTDWISAAGRVKLQHYGIVPPQCRAEQSIRVVPRLRCPRCDSGATQQLSRFGSTACKSTWRCIDCGEPFEYFKPF
ncbi:1,2-phenylacetyl-CoA epoxidase subunit PaaD [Pelomonas cellulosilytica]|uniref:Phenylacetate-CoA oxygenase subunit PaaJ n=1 Tax=Pelomonas cellulosilytica TaxID=2906762 RepID=A0ABS8XRH2_9BURK|nr:1,2-phenylacetyl-CoA epoxidase subunit PaaD [Pelomonas sp. P8]MCE4554453.1 phenylacetate-CoA oxygenase subunit PaaJ [Pelomonas sp. P8]